MLTWLDPKAGYLSNQVKSRESVCVFSCVRVLKAAKVFHYIFPTALLDCS